MSPKRDCEGMPIGGSDIEKYTNGHIYETDTPIFIKVVAKCKSLQPLSPGMKDNLYERIPFIKRYVIISCGIYTTGVKLGHVKNALFGGLTISMYTTPKSL